MAFSTAGTNFKVGGQLFTLAIILFVAWLVGLGLFELAGTAIRLLIVLAVVALIFRMVWGRPARRDRASPVGRPQARHGNERSRFVPRSCPRLPEVLARPLQSRGNHGGNHEEITLRVGDGSRSGGDSDSRRAWPAQATSRSSTPTTRRRRRPRHPPAVVPVQEPAPVVVPAAAAVIHEDVQPPHNVMATITVSALMGGIAGLLVGGAIYYLADNQEHAARIGIWAAGGVLVGTGVGIVQVAADESRANTAVSQLWSPDPAPTYRLALFQAQLLALARRGAGARRRMPKRRA